MNRRTKTVYSYDDRKRFVGTELAYETWDLAEPPIWLIPSFTTEKEPPPFNTQTESAVFNEVKKEWVVIETPTPKNTPQPEYDPIYFEPVWNEKEEKWDLKKLRPSEHNTPKPKYNEETHHISWSNVKKIWEIVELPSPNNTPKPKFNEVYTEENYEIIWNLERRSWEFKRKINWNYIKELRSARLKQSDWTILPDANPKPSKEAWLEYRQVLRDIPQKFSNPEDVIWPLPPQ